MFKINLNCVVSCTQIQNKAYNVTLKSKHCCIGNGIIITYSECVFVPLGKERAKRLRHII